MGSKTRLSSYCTKRANNGVNLATSRKINTRLARPIPLHLRRQGFSFTQQIHRNTNDADDVSDISCDDPSRCKSSQRVCRGVASTRTHENVFYIIYFFADEGVPVSCVASRRSVYVLQLQILATARCSQLLRVCRA